MQAARERAENRAAEPALPPPARPRLTEPASPVPQPSGQRPKFSFADEPSEAPPSTGARPLNSPLVPPRPALGSGERTQPPFLRQASQPAAYRAETPPYRPVDPAGGGYTPSRPLAPPPRGAYGNEPGTLSGPARRPPAYESYARSTEPPLDRGYHDEQPRLSRPPAPRGRARSYEEDQEDVFEDDAPPPSRRRASAKDYQSAYQEHEAPYEDDRRRSSGPLLILLALVLVLAAAGSAWYYMKFMRNPVTGATQTDQVPVVAAPDQPAKTAPETPPDANNAASPAAQRKQIYDRIVGEQEVTGDQQVVPTEEVPVQPEPATPPADATTGQQDSNTSGATAVPEPAAPAAPGDATQEPEPLPLPPPPGNDQQGSLDQSGAATLAAKAAEPAAIPPPDTTALEGAANSEQASPPSNEKPADTASTATDTESVIEAPAVKPKAEAAKKAATKTKTATATTTKKKPAANPDDSMGAEPVVLVPPSQDAQNPIQGGGTEAASAAPAPPAAEAPKKKRTLFDLFNKSGSETQPAQQQEQVASIEPEPAPAPAPSKPAAKAPAPAPAPETASSGSGYTIQLASFRSQSEAQDEYNRLKSSYPDVIGNLPSRISQATVAGSTRYRVGVGPLQSREQASKVCNSLFAAGERDCLIRGP